MYTATISAKGQITLPAGIRKRLGIQPNDRVALILRGDEIILKVLQGTIRDLRGTLHPITRPENFDDLRNKVKATLAQHSD